MEQEKYNDEILKAIAVCAAFAVLYKIGSLVFSWGKRFYQDSPILFYTCLITAMATIAILISRKLLQKYLSFKAEQEITNGKGDDSVYAGRSSEGKDVYVNLSFRRMHTQVVGTTNAGKTESVILPWIIDDIEKGRGLVFIDGKADAHLLNKIYAYVCKSGRQNDFQLLSLSKVAQSSTYNPLIGRPSQVTEKIINSFQIENEYYRTLQFDILRTVLEVFQEANEVPDFQKVKQAISNPAELQKLLNRVHNVHLKEAALDFINTNKEKRRELVSGLISNLSFFTANEFSQMFNTSTPSINITEAMENGKIIFFQVPVLQSPILGKAVAKMALQDIQTAVSIRHASGKPEHPFFSIYLDDFAEYLTPQFVSLLNKSRSANVGVVFAHQAVGDLEVLGPEIKNQILTNSNLKIFMRTNEPDSAEYFSKMVGTREGHKVTFRQKESLFGNNVTGDGSIRDVEEFIYHPNVFKSELGLGEAIMILPHNKGTKTVKLKFSIRPNLPVVPLPIIAKETLKVFSASPSAVDPKQSLASLAASEVVNELS